MDFNYFLRLLLDRKWLIMLVAVLAASATYFITKQDSEVYKSKALLDTGITESKAPTAGIDQTAALRPFEVEQQFSNLIEIINSRTVIGLLSHRLIMHDLTSSNPLKTQEALQEEFSPAELERAIQLFEDKFSAGGKRFSVEKNFNNSPELYMEERLANDSSLVDSHVPQMTRNSDVFGNTEDDEFLKQVLGLAGYDYEALLRDLRIFRVRNTDFLKFEYYSESPFLSSFVVNTLSEEFIKYYSKVKAERSDNSVDFFTKLAFTKKKELDRKNEELKTYKLDRQIVSIDDQSSARLAQIQELEMLRKDEASKIPANRQAMATIDRQLSSVTDAVDAIQASNQRIRILQNDISSLESRAIAARAEGLDDSVYQVDIDSKEKDLENLLIELASSDPSLDAATQELIATRLNMEIEIEIARSKVASIDGELSGLYASVGDFVKDDATIQAMDREITVAQDEYIDIVNKLNMAKLMSLTSGNQLTLIERGQVPGTPEPGKSLMMSAFAGMLAFAFCIVGIFALAYLDMTLKTPDRFKRMTDIPLLGYLNQLKFSNLDLETFFNQKSHDGELETFKQLLRKIRFRLEQNGAKRVLVTSTKESEGKTFLIISLAYSLSLNNKRILLIDTNFKNNSLTTMLQESDQENLISNTKLIGEADLGEEFTTTGIISRTNHSGIDIIGSKGGYSSPSEIFAGKNFNKLLDKLELNYDYIFMEGSSMNDFSDTEELAEYVDHVIPVFSAESKLNAIDKQSLEYLKGLEEKLLGGVLNRVDLKNTA
ncbi:MAG: succinoglycan biosynthesis transport protein ExoP [Limisphaerales bacterium]|jgi:succinoglycan biosynthesis transport protein ExoP